MNYILFFQYIKNFLAVPSTLIFFLAAVILTFKTGFLQFRGFRRFIRLITVNLGRRKAGELKTINAFHALFTAMSTTIGVGNVVGPSVAIIIGGPGALFWLLVYMFFASATKYTEVVLAIKYRERTSDGRILGGPAEYLKHVRPYLAHWFGLVTIFLFAGWSGLQANSLAEILAQQSVPEWITGLLLAVFVFIVLVGGAKRVGEVSSRIVPIMFVLYVTFTIVILLGDIAALKQAFVLIGRSVISPSAPIGGFLGSTIFAAMQEGAYKAIYVSEAGVGTSSIPHSMSDVSNPTDQGLLAMFSMMADAFLCLISGLLVLSTGLWQGGVLTATTVYRIFEVYYPVIGPLVFAACIILFISGTTIGNGFNGSQSFASFTRYRWINWYYGFIALTVFLGAISDVPLIWAIMEFLLPLVAIPNLIGVLILAFRK